MDACHLDSLTTCQDDNRKRRNGIERVPAIVLL